MNSIPINIMDAILTCDFQDKFKDYITSLFFDVFLEKKCNIYQVAGYNAKLRKNEKIMVIRWIISIMLQNRNYDIPILIYLPRNFPEEAPELYIEKTDEIGVNPKASYVDKTTLRIVVPLLVNWNPSTSNLSNILNQVHMEFSKFFPIFKLDIRERGKYKYGENCVLNPNSIRAVSFEAVSMIDKFSPASPVVSKGDPKINTKTNPKVIIDPNILSQINFYDNQPVNPLVSYSDDQIKKILINEMACVLLPKLKIEVSKLKADEMKLRVYEKDFSHQSEQVKTLAEKKEEILNRIKSLSAGIQDQIFMLKYYIEANSNKEIHKDKLEKLVKISNPNKLKMITSEATSEDFLFYIKKAYEKKIFNFPQTIKLIRNHSRELFSIKYVKERSKDK